MAFMIPEHLKKQLDSSDSEALRVIATYLFERAHDNGKAARNLADAVRDILELLRRGRISQAIEIAEGFVEILDAAAAADATHDRERLETEDNGLAYVQARGRA